ncbi:MAG: hypothetical protein A3H01_00560 [Candidatus Wildermuthbacteria bacterium RIFCSPLOWO2_12_FULL_40_9]|uniref:Uncharacterized protein n=1 Tax=Candidatus Wildermuthbacteria bacterium RIFCSPLOWO2_12_FULL_40_9 TaxID=1802467 RepID=A0A1G2RWR2_9BACT|nr:MAG: hypothetical protein A3H01_00560 [Candidatus Wildermuthbacteria bacterium RIFCSPLOWO2_12_FULL_40_9]
MVNITVSKKEYQKLLDRALRYEYLRQILAEDVFSPPPTRNAKAIIKEFRATKKYSKKFIDSLSRGLKRSSYFK